MVPSVWNPTITITQVGGATVGEVATILDFDNIPGCQYTAHSIPKRLCNAISIEAINNHYPSCGTRATSNTLTDQNRIWLHIEGAGETYLCYISAYDGTLSGKVNSQVFEFKTNGVNAGGWCQDLGCMEYCRMDSGAVIPPPISPVPAPTKIIKHGKK